MGPCIVNIFQYISNKMQLYTVYLYLETALYVLGGTYTHHQECIQLYLQHLVFVRPLLLSAAIAAGSSNGLTSTRCCTVVCAPDDGWSYHPKHAEQFSDINKLCKVASCSLYIGMHHFLFFFNSCCNLFHNLDTVVTNITGVNSTSVEIQ